jgi:peroxiredoxin
VSGGRPAIALIGLAALWVCGVAHCGDLGGNAPQFERPDLSGQPVRLAGLRGKVVLLNFWASWCTPCLEEMPRLSAWQREYGRAGLQVLGVSMDDEAAPVHRFLAKHPVAYPVLMGDAKLAESFGGVLGLPCSFLIDAQGRIVARFQGESDLDQIEARIKALLPDSRL